MQPINLHSPQNWRVVRETLHELTRLTTAARAGSNVLVPGPRFAHHSELIFAHVRFDHPVANMVSEYMLEAVRSQLSDCGDGGKTVVALTAALIEAFAPLCILDGWTAKQKQDWKEMVACVGFELCGYPSQPGDRERFLSQELRDLDEDLTSLLQDFFQQAGDEAQLMVIEGPRENPSLRTTNGYRYQTPRPPDVSLKEAGLTSIEAPMVLCVDAPLADPESLRSAFEVPAGVEAPCVVFCRSAGPLVTPTLLGNYRETGAKWMVYEISNDQIFDFAAIAGTKVWPCLKQFTPEDFGYADEVDWLEGCVGLRRAGVESSEDLLDHVAAVQSRRGVGTGYEQELTDHRLALLTGDYWELEVGQRYTPAERQWLKERIRLTAQAATNFSRGSSAPYAFDIRTAIRGYVQPSFDSKTVERILRAFDYKDEPDCPFPHISDKIWTRATNMAWLLLSTQVALL